MKNNFTQLISKVNRSNWQPHLAGLLLLFMMLVSQVAVGQVITSISPTCKTAGEGNFALTINGRDFNGNPTVRLNGTSVSYSVSNGNTVITVQVPASFIATAGNLNIEVSKGSTIATSLLTVAPATNAGQITTSLTSVCAGTQGVTYTITSVTGAQSYAWTVPSGATIVSGANTNQITVNYAQNATSGAVTVTARNGCGTAGTTSSLNVTVNPIPAAPTVPTPTALCGPGTATITAQAAQNANSARWYSGSGDLVHTGLTYSPNISETTTFTVRGYNSDTGCESTASTSVTATVNIPLSAVISAPNGTTACAAKTVALVAEEVAGATYQWQVNGSNINGATDPSYDASTSGNYRVLVTTNNCTATSNVISVTVNTLPSASITGQLAFCTGESTTLTVNTNNGTSFKWFRNGEEIDNSNSNSLVVAQVGNYSVQVTNGNGCSTTTAEVVVIENTLPSATISFEGSTTICNREELVLNAPVGTGYTYVWSRNGNTISGATAEKYTVTTSGEYRVTVTNSNGCSSTSAGLSITVNPLPTAVITQGSNVEYCEGASTTLNAQTGTGYSYQWFVNGENLPGATGSSVTVNEPGDYTVEVTLNGCSQLSSATTVIEKPLPVAEVNPASSLTLCSGENVILNATTGAGYTYRWFRVGSNTVLSTSASYTASVAGDYVVEVTSNGCTLISQPVTVVVNPLPTATITPQGPTNFCEGNSVRLQASTATGNTYAWFEIEEDGTETDLNESGSFLDVEDSGNYAVRITNSLGCSRTSAPIKVTVVTIDPNTATITNTGPLTFCEGGEVLLQAAQAPSGQVYNYQWQVNYGSGETTWQNIEEEDGRKQSYTAEASGRYRVVVTNVPQDGEAQCDKTSSPLTVTVNPLPSAPSVTNNARCGAGPLTLTSTVGANGTVNRWYSAASGGSPFFTGTSYAITNLTATTTYYVSSFNTTTQCEGPRVAITATLNPIPSTNAIGSRTHCNGAAGNAIAFTGSVAGATYTWTSSINVGFGVSGTGNIPAYTATNTGTTPIIATVTVTASTVDCEGPSQTFTVTVNPTPTITSVVNRTHCAGEAATSIAIGGAVTGTTYTWSSSANVGFGLSGTGSIPAYTATNSTGAPVTATVTVTATANGCAAVSETFTVTVNPTPSINTITSRTHCNGAAGGAINFTGSVPSATYTWTSTANVGFGTGGTGNIGAYTAINTSNAPVTATVTVTASTAACAGEVKTFTVTVNPTPTITSVANRTHCAGEAATGIAIGGAVTGTAYTWTSSANVGFGLSGTGSIPAYTATNSTGAPVTATVTVTATANGCAAVSKTFTVTVNPTPTITQVANRTHCNGELAPAINFSGSLAGATYTWSSSANVGFGTGGTGSIPAYTATNQFATSATVTVRASTASCQSTVMSFTVSVSQNQAVSFTGTIATTDLFYTGQSPITLTATPGGNGVFSGTGVSGTTFSSCVAGPGTHTITYTRTTGNCTSTVSKTVTVRQSTYTTVVTADPFPTCKGQNTTYTARVYRDAEVIYPYLVNSQGIPVKSDRVTPIGAKEFPVPNPAYFDNFDNMPEILKINAYRYFQPKIVGGTEMPATAFDYAWTKNMDGTQFANSPTINNAGLSSLDYYAVYVTSKAGTGTTCAPAINRKISNRVYTAAPVAYEVNITSDNIICQGGSVGVRANLNDAFSFWNDISLTLFLMHSRNGVITQLEQRAYRTSDGFTVNFTTDGSAVGGLQNGDLLYIEFSSVIDQQNDVRSKCSQDFMTNQIAVTVVATQTMTAGAARCIDGAGVPVGLTSSQAGVRYQLKRDGVNVGSPIVGTGNAISFGSFTQAGTYSVEALAGTAACTSFGATVINVTPLPVAQTLTAPNNGEFCAGGSGVVLTLSGSQTGVSYQLRRSVGNITTDVGAPITGSGSAIVFPAQTTAGIYSVVATTIASNGVAGGCSQPMGSAEIKINPLPSVQTFTGGGSYCAGSGGVPIGLQNSQSGITYNLRNSAGNNVATVVSTGGAITFGNFTAGTYSIEAVNAATTCTFNMPGTIQVVENPQPIVYSVTGGGRFCADGTGVAIGLGDSQSGVSYQLVRTVNGSSENVGGPVSGTGSEITFGLQTAAGAYSVVATSNTSPPCPIPMNGIATITIDELPMEITAVSGEYCERLGATGAEISLPSSQLGVNYQLVNSRGDNVGSSMAGNDGPLNFGQHLEGVYRIIATNNATSCNRVLSVPEIIANPIIIATGDIYIYDADGQRVEPTAVEVGKTYTFEANSNVLDNGHTNAAAIQWFVGEEGNWGDPVWYGRTYTVEITESLKISVKCELPLIEGVCYDWEEFFLLSIQNIIPLPVELMYFKATKRGNDVAMEWATASELDNKGFEVQVSTDAKNFRSLGFVESKVGTSSLKQTYTFVDQENGKYGTRYYRLKQVDLDGKFEYFNAKPVHFGEVAVNKVKAYPNPFQSEVELSIDAEEEGSMLITVTSTTGQQLLQRTIKVEKGANIEKLRLDPNLPRGVYIISTRMGELNSHFKLLKQ